MDTVNNRSRRYDIVNGVIGGTYYPGLGLDPDLVVADLHSEEAILTLSHKRTRKGYLEGGSFILTRAGVKSDPVHKHWLVSGGPIYKDSDVYAWSLNNAPSMPGPFNETTMNGLGATGIARFKPTKPQASLFQALAELREIPTIPSVNNLRSSHKNLLQGGASEHLNLQFGWLPLLSDIKAAIVAIVNLDKNLKQLIKDNGKPVHRSGMIYNNNFSNPAEDLGLFGGAPAIFDLGHLSKTYSVMDVAWFKGTFQYYIPFNKGTSFLLNAKMYRQLNRILFGLDLNIKTAWDLIPWSWLLDWLGNFGSVLSNMSDIGEDGLIIQHAYVMRHWRESVLYSLAFDDGTFSHQEFFSEVKERLPATPYGFGLNPQEFSLKQQSIIAALALKK